MGVIGSATARRHHDAPTLSPPVDDRDDAVGEDSVTHRADLSPPLRRRRPSSQQKPQCLQTETGESRSDGPYETPESPWGSGVAGVAVEVLRVPGPHGCEDGVLPHGP